MKQLFKKNIKLSLPFFILIIIFSFSNSPKVEATTVTANVYAKVYNSGANPINPLTITGSQYVEISAIPTEVATSCTLSSPTYPDIQTITKTILRNSNIIFGKVFISHTTTYSVTCDYTAPKSCTGTYTVSTKDRKIDWLGNPFNWILNAEYGSGATQDNSCPQYVYYTKDGRSWSYQTKDGLYPDIRSIGSFDDCLTTNTVLTHNLTYSYYNSTKLCSAFSNEQTCTNYNGCTWAQPSLVNGTCDNSQNNACLAGSLNDIADSSTNYLWQCVGLNGGTTDSCSKSKSINGFCKFYPSVYYFQPATSTVTGCRTGAYSDYADTSTDWRWRCNGSNGGSSPICSALKYVSGGGGLKKSFGGIKL